MQGSLRLHGGVLYLGTHGLSARVRSFDLDGRPLETGFSFRDDERGSSSAVGLDVDEDRRLWVADGAARALRCFTLFGVEVATVRDPGPWSPVPRDGRGLVGSPVDLRVVGADDEQSVLLASGGVRRHGLQVLHLASGKGRSVAPLGDPEGRFQRITSIDLVGRELAVCESSPGRVQVFEGDVLGRLVFRFAFPVPQELGRPEAVALVGDGRVLVATGGEVSRLLVFDGAGALTGVMGRESGPFQVEEPSALALEDVRLGHPDRTRRLAVLDRDGGRVQVMSLDGRHFGSFGVLDGDSVPPAEGASQWDEGGAFEAFPSGDSLNHRD